MKINIIKATTFFKRLKGFMFTNKSSYALLFLKTSAIHTFFMRFDIDVYALNKNLKVINIQKKVKKNRLLYFKKCYAILEIPSNLNIEYKLNESIY